MGPNPHTGKLSPIAQKRLEKEAKAWANSSDNILTSHGTISAIPYSNDYSRWCANLLISEGVYEGINFHIYIEVPEDYPISPPSAYFRSEIIYTSGAQYHVEGKGISICLNLLGNFAFVHTEWAASGEASGWSPSYTISTILITLQGALPDLLADHGVGNTRYSSKACTCQCGHTGGNRLKFYPPLGCFSPKKDEAAAAEVKEAKQPAVAPAMNPKAVAVNVMPQLAVSPQPTLNLTNSDQQVEEAKRVLSKLPKDKLIELIITYIPLVSILNFILSIVNGATLFPNSSLEDEEFDSEENQAEQGINQSEDSTEPATPPPSLSHITCYATSLSPDTDLDEVFGYGISIDYQGNMETPAEFLTKAAFDSGVKRSTLNQHLDFFLPLYISYQHWTSPASSAFAVFRENMTQIYQHTSKLSPKNFPAPPIQALMVLLSLMNTTCLAVEKTDSSQSTASDRFINGYFSILRLVKGLKKNFAKTIEDYANKKISAFLRSAEGRNKDPVYGCPNLGEFILLLHVSSKYNWKHIAKIFCEESDARRVRWYLRTNPELDNDEDYQYSLHNDLIFELTETSRRLIAFQVKFLQISSRVDLNSFVDGDVPENLLRELKNIHKAVAGLDSWRTYNMYLDVPAGSDRERGQQLLRALHISRERGYHGSRGPNHLHYNRQQQERYPDYDKPVRPGRGRGFGGRGGNNYGRY